MRQRYDSQLINPLNSARTGEVQPENINILKSRVLQPGAENYSHNTLHVFAENVNTSRFNDKMLNSNESNLFS